MKAKNDENQGGFQSLQLTAHKEILTFKESVLYLSISPSFLYKLTSRGGINFTKPNGGKIYFKKSDLDKWMLQNENRTANDIAEDLTLKISKHGK